MKKYFLIYLLLLNAGCSYSGVGSKVYWCGDHACKNTKEKEEYFKKTMIVEIKDTSDINKKDKSKIQGVLEQSRIYEVKDSEVEKKIAEQTKLDNKRRIQNEKELVKQAKLDNKRRIQNEKELAKQAKLDKKRGIQNEKDLSKQIKIDEKKLIKNKVLEKTKIPEDGIKLKNNDTILKTSNNKVTDKFTNAFENIMKKNSFKEYPDINRIEY